MVRALLLVSIGLVACGGSSDPGPATGASASASSTGAGSKGLASGAQAEREWAGPAGESGRWHRVGTPGEELTEDQRARVSELEAIGYAGGTEPATALRGVTVHDRERAEQGLNLYTSGHAPEAVLMDMDGRVLHRWHASYRELWPDDTVGEEHVGTQHWRRARLLEGGDLLVVQAGVGIARLDRDSNVVWKNPCRAHHDLDVLPSGEVYTLTRRVGLHPFLDEDEPVVEDFVTVLDERGELLDELSLLEVFRDSEYASRAFRLRAGDVFHTNSIQVITAALAEKTSVFRAGNVLISMRENDLVAAVDLESRSVVWVEEGWFKAQHDPRLLDSGRILLFDNEGLGEERSRVVEWDPRTGERVWTYGRARELYSGTCGAAQRLANGNTLITESDRGRALEVTPDKVIVWEFYNPHRAGEQDEFVATLFEVTRLPAQTPLDWLE